MNKRTIGLGVCFLSLLWWIRVPFVGHYPESWDAVDFALALERYDIHAMQPHFPGYPLLIFPALILHRWIENPYLALSMVSLCAGLISIVFFYLLAQRFLLPIWARMATLFFAVHPLLWLTSLQPMSDSLGLSVALGYLYVLSWSLDRPKDRRRQGRALVIAAILYALLLGVRLSYFPLATVWLFALWQFHRRQGKWDFSSWSYRYPLLAICLGMLTLCSWVWFASQSEGGVFPYLKLGQAFLSGHFTDWGGTAWSENEGVLARGSLLIRGAWSAIFAGSLSGEAMGFVWGAMLFILLTLVGVRKFALQRAALFLYITMVPMWIWIFWGQNIDKPRHLIPLIPIVLLLAMYGTMEWTKAAGWRKSVAQISMLVILISQIWMIYQLASEYQQHPPPVVQLTTYLQQHIQPDHTLIITWEEERVIDAITPVYTTERLQHWSVFLTTIRRYPQGTNVYLTSSVVEGLRAQKHDLLPDASPLATWKASERLYSPYQQITLYQLDVASLMLKVKE